ncbi:cupin domain-containing protein [Sulfurirhabdus autotrophica]|uniref:Mannose-6-phosphate isomerase-like protein (Cupin superfamily) n=1 Tax=Sulfurirhabdus autotrophica TaxID=1706046 RepID=A0A4V2W0S2_9PROT|nr:cupin domain-containing protein [Sulfurirhabdus autotrophica]TCV79979.1 mannose-6-phosphate isomerase-like protein (cupin superfamily) [Sulfurirhabdus autotrophica]
MKHKRVFGEQVSDDDILVFSKEIADGQTIKLEDFSNDVYLDEVIDKPWGFEHRVYADLLLDVWRLSVTTGQSTSMHCHPRKETVLICLQGDIRVNFIRSSHLLKQGDFISIPKGVFHSTDSIGESTAELIEVETPRNKFDLVRTKDKYGRQGQFYEKTKSLQPICPMSSDSLQPHAKMRSSDLHGDFYFSIAPGHGINTELQFNPEFAISLALEDAIKQKIEVISLTSDFSGQLGNQTPYLVVSRNQT